MKAVFTSSQSREFDRYLIDQIGLPSLVLMENAARGTLYEIEDWLGDTIEPRVLIFAGTGNNGGDGFAVARLLRESDIPVRLILVGAFDKLSADAKTQYEILSLIDCTAIREAATEKEIRSASDEFERPTLIVDALLGTGSAGQIREPFAAAVRVINELRKSHSHPKVLSLDLPTGLNGDKGNSAKDTQTVVADRTVAMGAAKVGFYQQDSAAFTGSISVAQLGAPVSFKKLSGDATYRVERSDIIERYPTLNATANKFTRGRVLAVCGSRGMTGAAIMAATAALRSGCGLINVAVPKSERSLVAQAMPELLTVGCTEQEDGAPDIAAWDELQEHLDRADVILVGSGLRPWRGTTELLLKIISNVDKPMVIDAGAIGALVGHLDLLTERSAPTILTPHSGELSRILERPWQEIEPDRLELARECAKKYGVTIAMKGAPTFTIAPDGTAYINSTGNAGLATAGSGDVLAGIMAGTFAQLREDPVATCMIGVYLHGLAGDFAAKEKTKQGMTATDVNEMLPLAFKALGVN